MNGCVACDTYSVVFCNTVQLLAAEMKSIYSIANETAIGSHIRFVLNRRNTSNTDTWIAQTSKNHCLAVVDILSKYSHGFLAVSSSPAQFGMPYGSVVLTYRNKTPTNSMEQSPTWEADSCWTSQEIYCVCWNMKGHCCSCTILALFASVPDEFTQLLLH